MHDDEPSADEGQAGPRTPKGARTKAHILARALELFRERGYEASTMRDIAGAAEVSVGSAYYYFPSKEHLVQAFYADVNRAHDAASRRVLRDETDLGRRLVGVLRAQIQVFEPYHEFARVLFRTAGDPQSPLNPFSEASRPVRGMATGLMEEVVSGAKGWIAKDLEAELPDLLWVYLAGITLYWVHDTSPGRARTYRLIEDSAALVVRLVRSAGLPFMRPMRRMALSMVRRALGREDE